MHDDDGETNILPAIDENIVVTFDREKRVITYQSNTTHPMMINVAPRKLVGALILGLMESQGWNTILVPPLEHMPITFSAKHTIVTGAIEMDCDDEGHDHSDDGM